MEREPFDPALVKAGKPQVDSLQISTDLPHEATLYVDQGIANLNLLPRHQQLIRKLAAEWHPTDD
jgi:hypothetical protein